MNEINKLSITESLERIEKGSLSRGELFSAFYDFAKDNDKKINGFLEIFDVSSGDAEKAEGPLAGMPIAIKDNLCFKGHRASAASRILDGFVAPYTATAVQRLLDAGAVITGRTNMDEFAMGSSTENSAFGVTKNPHDEERVAGGSSGGSAAVVALGEAIAALGSETGGSIRQPASFCGVVGLKPTYGAVSRHGLMAMGSSLDQIGPIAKTVSDTELVFNIIKGRDKMDATSFYPESAASADFAKVIGVPKGITSWEGIDKEVVDNFNESVEKLKSLGYEIREIDLPNLPYALAVYYIIMPAEVSSNLARFDGVKYGAKKEGRDLLEDYMNTRGEYFGREARRRILLGTYVLSSGYYDAFYGSAIKAKSLITGEIKRAFSEVSAIITPTTPTPAFKIGEKTKDPLSMYMADMFTVSANISGVPAISVPSGFAQKEGKSLPLGLHIMSDHFREDILFRMGKEFLGENVAQ